MSGVIYRCTKKFPPRKQKSVRAVPIKTAPAKPVRKPGGAPKN